MQKSDNRWDRKVKSLIRKYGRNGRSHSLVDASGNSSSLTEPVWWGEMLCTKVTALSSWYITALEYAFHGFFSWIYIFGGRFAFLFLCLKLWCRLTCSNCSNAFISSPAILCFVLSALGITAGSHRLWSHRSYKATLPLRIFLTIANSMAFQVSTCSLCGKKSWERCALPSLCFRYRAQDSDRFLSPTTFC